MAKDDPFRHGARPDFRGVGDLRPLPEGNAEAMKGPTGVNKIPNWCGVDDSRNSPDPDASVEPKINKIPSHNKTSGDRGSKASWDPDND